MVEFGVHLSSANGNVSEVRVGKTADASLLLKTRCTPSERYSMNRVDDFLSNNVNGFSGNIVLTDTYVHRLHPETVGAFVGDRFCFTHAPEAHHIDQFAFKLTTILRIGRVTAVTLLTKDGSPHSVQMHMTAQEAAANVGFNDARMTHFVVERGVIHEVTSAAVRASRHLAEVTSILHSGESCVVPQREAKLAILVGGRSDLPQVRESTLFQTLQQLGIEFTVAVISSEQNPEQLRTYCKSLKRREVRIAICIAGAVPGLPAAVKAHLPTMPVIAVPLTGGGLNATEIMLGALSLPARRPVILTGLDRAGLRKAARLAAEYLAAADDRLAAAYDEFVRNDTPEPDYWVPVEEPSVEDELQKQKLARRT